MGFTFRDISCPHGCERPSVLLLLSCDLESVRDFSIHMWKDGLQLLLQLSFTVCIANNFWSSRESHCPDPKNFWTRLQLTFYKGIFFCCLFFLVLSTSKVWPVSSSFFFSFSFFPFLGGRFFFPYDVRLFLGRISV